MDKLEEQFINDVKLLAFVEAPSAEEAQQQVLGLFPDAEFDKCEQVSTEVKMQIIGMIQHTLAQAQREQE